jgi:hypothetical protein
MYIVYYGGCALFGCDEVIPFPRITSSVNAGFPVLLSELVGRQNKLAA